MRILRHIALVLALAAAVAAGTTSVLRADLQSVPCTMMDHGEDEGAPCSPSACPLALCAATPFVPPTLAMSLATVTHAEMRFIMPADLDITGEHPPPPQRPPIA